MMDEEYRGGEPTEGAAEPEKKEETGQPAHDVPRRERSASSGSNSAKKGDRVHASTAGESGKSHTNAKTAPKKEKVQLKQDRSERPAHRVIPYILLGVGVFLSLCLLFNLICNFGNKLSENPSAHWMGKVGYQICYGLFG